MKTPLLFLIMGLALLFSANFAEAEDAAPATAAPVTKPAAPPFHFEDYKTLDAMRQYIEQTMPLGTSRDDFRAAFVTSGGAKSYTHPKYDQTEKYVYDINLCDLYIWRWNISADYDDSNHLVQAYVNGRSVFMAGKAARYARYESAGAYSKIVGMTRHVPEATKGQKYIPFTVFDGDGDTRTTSDEFATGFGPAAADPAWLSQMASYKDVELWRSIFSTDGGMKIVPYNGTCHTGK